MEVVRGSIKDLYSCNACKRGTLKEDKIGLEYPYEQVTVIEAISISLRLCDDCLDELKKKI